MVNLYAFYILDLALRVSLLETIGITVDGRMKEYLLDENLDWIRLERHLEADASKTTKQPEGIKNIFVTGWLGKKENMRNDRNFGNIDRAILCFQELYTLGNGGSFSVHFDNGDILL